ncbi:MAG: gamma-glutamyl-gamma-aminobutyrate hydrolase family protein [Armatimonadetes bacterium]|nr:gamma-glutamyl-gamma-aminobutyrate hydrolase family protein [Armatimonadota bacterium]
MKPIIGITVEAKFDPSNPRSRGSLALNWNYAEEVEKAGGIPLLIPPMADPSPLAEIIHGWLIPGGADIDAREFGEENHPEVELGDPARFGVEKKLYQAVSADLPILGICYGCQFLNVVQGGTLIQHLPDVVYHGEHSGGTLQAYSLDADSRLAGVAGQTAIEGKSYHHQAIGRPGADVTVVGHAEDGTVEAIELSGRPWVFGVQWHPERTPDDSATQSIFAKFVAAARAYAESKHGVRA